MFFFIYIYMYVCVCLSSLGDCIYFMIECYMFESVYNINYCYWCNQKHCHVIIITNIPRDVDQNNMFIFWLLLFYFTIYVFVLQYVSTFIKCDNILFYQPLTICAIRYYTDKVNVCCVLFFLYAFFFRLWIF